MTERAPARPKEIGTPPGWKSKKKKRIRYGVVQTGWTVRVTGPLVRPRPSGGSLGEQPNKNGQLCVPGVAGKNPNLKAGVLQGNAKQFHSQGGRKGQA